MLVIDGCTAFLRSKCAAETGSKAYFWYNHLSGHHWENEMNRIGDIEKELLNPNCDIVNLLRWSHLFAVENHLYDFDQWTLWELNGYPEDADLPSYRVLQGKLNAYNPATGWVAFNVRSAAKEKELCTQNIRDSISSLVSLLETGTPPFHVELSGEQQSLLNAAVAMPGTMKYAIHYSRGQVNDIIENVKTCLLEHIASLRKEGKIETGKELPSGARQATDDAKIDKTVFISHRSVDKYIADILLEFFYLLKCSLIIAGNAAGQIVILMKQKQPGQQLISKS